MTHDEQLRRTRIVQEENIEFLRQIASRPDSPTYWRDYVAHFRTSVSIDNESFGKTHDLTPRQWKAGE